MVLFSLYGVYFLKNQKGIKKKNNDYVHSARQDKTVQTEHILIVFLRFYGFMDIDDSLGRIFGKPAYRLHKNKNR